MTERLTRQQLERVGRHLQEAKVARLTEALNEIIDESNPVSSYSRTDLTDLARAALADGENDG